MVDEETRVPTLEEMAQAIDAKRRERETALARLAELTPAYDEARERTRQLAKELKEMERAMGGAQQAHAIERALAEAGIEFEGPRLVPVREYSGHRWYVLAAVGPKGTGLYLHTPDRSGRYSGKSWAVLRERALTQGFDPDAPRGNRHDLTQKSQEDAGLLAWQARGKGDFGFSGAFRPTAPPEGGKWRWLKVREQESLAKGEVA